MMGKDRHMHRAFTLIEVIVTIALIGVVSVLVITTVDPIDQLKRTRDTRYISYASQLLGAIDRYYAVKGEYPWVTVNFVPENESVLSFAAAHYTRVGVCSGGCNNNGPLIEALELREEFRKNEFFWVDPSIRQENIWIGKQEGLSASVYACLGLNSKSMRNSAKKDGKVFIVTNYGWSTPDMAVPSSSQCTPNSWAETCMYCFSQ